MAEISGDCVNMSCGNSTAIVCPEIGGNPIGLCLGGQEILRQPSSLDALHQNPFVFGSPYLFPPNRICDGTFTYEGRQYHLPVNEPSRGNHNHGFVSDAPFRVIAHGKTDDRETLTLRYHSGCDRRYTSQDLLFAIQATYTLAEGSFTEEVRLENEGFPLPLGIGRHTTFFTPHPDSTFLMIPALKEWELSEDRILPSGISGENQLCRQLNSSEIVPCRIPLSDLFTLSCGEIALTDNAASRIIRYRMENYPFMMVWNDDASREFVCCEPQSWLVNAPNLPLPAEETGFLPLKPWEERIYRTAYTVEKM